MSYLGTALRLHMLLLLMVATGCQPNAQTTGEEQAAPEEEAAPTGETRSETTTVGPVSATVSITPDKPRLGDRLRFELRVIAEPNVDIRMPAFDDQLGRFDIVDFTERENPGTGEHWRGYTLDLPMSGRQRIPQLLVEFVDRRPTRPEDIADDQVQELLTDELVIDVESILPETRVGTELEPAKGPLPALELHGQDRDIWPWVAGGSGVLLLLALIGLWTTGRATPQRIVPPHVVAKRALEALAKRGLPQDLDEADLWYVEVSSVVRKYLEGRFGLRAPELTTEEFLREARDADFLTQEHKDLLAALLARADKVKFAGYVPTVEESEASLQVAVRFVDDTRPTDTEEAP